MEAHLNPASRWDYELSESIWQAQGTRTQFVGCGSQHTLRLAYRAPRKTYLSFGVNCENASGAASSKRVNRLRKTNLTISVGPLRCFAMRRSVSSRSSGVAPALKKCGR